MNDTDQHTAGKKYQHFNYINYSLDNQNNILCYRRFDFTYWRPLPEVNPDEDFRREVEMSITKYVILVV